MKLDKTNVNETLNKAEMLLKEEQGVSPAIRAIIEILILFVRAFASRLAINSHNSSTPPSADKKRIHGRGSHILQNKKLSFNLPKA